MAGSGVLEIGAPGDGAILAGPARAVRSTSTTPNNDRDCPTTGTRHAEQTHYSGCAWRRPEQPSGQLASLEHAAACREHRSGKR